MPELGTSGSVRGRDGRPPGLLDRVFFREANMAERTRLLREIGDHKFTEFAEIPLFGLYADAAVHPKYIAEYTFPGVITGYFTHLEYVRLAP